MLSHLCDRTFLYLPSLASICILYQHSVLPSLVLPCLAPEIIPCLLCILKFISLLALSLRPRKTCSDLSYSIIPFPIPCGPTLYS